jgi:hypothetical protein
MCITHIIYIYDPPTPAVALAGAAPRSQSFACRIAWQEVAMGPMGHVIPAVNHPSSGAWKEPKKMPTPRIIRQAIHLTNMIRGW